MAALRQLAASWTTRGLLNVNIDQESIVNMLDPIQYQVLSCWQDRLRMARGRCHCKLSLKQYDYEMFGTILSGMIYTESAEDPFFTQRATKIHQTPKCGRSIFAPALTSMAMRWMRRMPLGPSTKMAGLVLR
jgi:hypothetical protein